MTRHRFGIQFVGEGRKAVRFGIVIDKESGDPGAPGPHSKAIDCGDLRVVFDWRGDRFGHVIEQRLDGNWRTVLKSAEGSVDEGWPPSPPLQSLHIEERPTGLVALLVGKSGTSHWSASIESAGSLDALQFDLACRTQGPPAQLGSEYQIAGSSDGSIVKVAALAEQTNCELIEQQECRFWRIRPHIASSCGYPCTIRWRYTISLDRSTA
jgi:hypothetical protein